LHIADFGFGRRVKAFEAFLDFLNEYPDLIVVFRGGLNFEM